MNKFRNFSDFILSYFIEDFDYDYWHCPHPCSTRILQGDYFIDFRHKINYPGPFDEEGIPLLKMNSQHWSTSTEEVYSQIVIAQYGLGHYSLFLENKAFLHRDKFLQIANWLKNHTHIIPEKNIEVYLMDIGLEDSPFFLSAMAQGLAISVLCRAYELTQSTEYLDKARALGKVFYLDADQGGVINYYKGVRVLEEWTNEGNHILNGHLFAFAGVIDLHRYFPQEYVALYTEILESSKQFVVLSDMGFWSKYSLKKHGIIPNITSFFYHKLHCDMLAGMFILTQEEVFQKYASRWHKQSHSYLYRIFAMCLKLLDRVNREVGRKLGY